MLTHGMVGVGYRRLKRIAEYRLSFCELDAVVFGVRRRLARVPFELHGPSVGLFAAIRSVWLLFGLTPRLQPRRPHDPPGRRLQAVVRRLMPYG